MTLAVILIIWIHFIADFIFQSDWMAVNKSRSWKALGAHIGVYSFVLFATCGWKYALANGAAHFVVDAVTSRLSSHLWRRNERHMFFVVIGADQALHMTCLVATLQLAGIYP